MDPTIHPKTKKKKEKKKVVSPSPQNPNQTPHIAKTLEKTPKSKYQKRKKFNANETENWNARSEMGIGTIKPGLAAGGNPLLLVLSRLGAISRRVATVQFHRNGFRFFYSIFGVLYRLRKLYRNETGAFLQEL
jgi:hypothetical protein